MTLPTVAFVNDVEHVTAGAASQKPLRPKKFNQKNKPKKSVIIQFSDSESDNDAPIPFLKRGDDSSSSFSDEEFDPSHAAVRKRFRRPIPKSRTADQSTGSAQEQPLPPRFRPQPPNAPKVPLRNNLKKRPNRILGKQENEEQINEKNSENSEKNSVEDENDAENNERREVEDIKVNEINNDGDEENKIKEVLQKKMDDLQIPTIIKKENKEEYMPPLCYFMERKIVSKIGKNRVSLTLTKGSVSVLFHLFDLSEESISMKYNNQKYSILMADSMTSFSLRQNSRYGDELFNILYQLEKKPVKHKICALHFFNKIKGVPVRLQSKPPILNADGEIIQAFGHRQVIPSVKNMLFLNKKQRELIAVMRISKTSICIEATPEIPEIMIFMLGVSAFLNH